MLRCMSPEMARLGLNGMSAFAPLSGGIVDIKRALIRGTLSDELVSTPVEAVAVPACALNGNSFNGR